ncbi:hypothetical protein HYV86_01315 [Candidatus Woesearchaeota archaeon]|nr:hypothetical protein [Candidatus Woesearchaeota archaeon]
MEHRKIQLVAGTTYQLSLPKQWVVKNNLKEGKELLVVERSDRSLLITTIDEKSLERKQISLPLDELETSVDRVLFTLYYLGFEDVELFSKKEIAKSVRMRVRQTLANMSGTEVTYEDPYKITIKILLDRERIDAIQVLYRISLIIGQSILSIENTPHLEDLDLNEREIDRLYHLICKILSLSMINTTLLHTSKIQNTGIITNYMIMAKKLENIGDRVYFLGKYHIEKKEGVKNKIEKECLDLIMNELSRSMKCILADYPTLFHRFDESVIRQKLYSIKEETIRENLYISLRYLIDIQEEVVSISFVKKLIREGKL